MSSRNLERALKAELRDMENAGGLKGAETVISAIVPATGDKGPRYKLEGAGERQYLRMNANGYLGMALRADVIDAGEDAARQFGAGPGAVRFISGTSTPHIDLERRLAAFHGRDAAMIFSSAYATVMGILPPLIGPETAVISDALNHNCIINAIRLARPGQTHIYAHCDLAELEQGLKAAAEGCSRAMVVTDGIFSMRGDHAPLADIAALVRRFDNDFAEGVVLMVDDSHGVGAFGKTGRGTEEHCGVTADILVGTLGKAFGVNGGYVTATPALIEYLREKAALYIYSNPITAGEAAAAAGAVDIVDGPEGTRLLGHLRAMTTRFEAGLGKLGLETIEGPHPIVPLMVRDTERTAALVRHLSDNGILATGLNYPVVPKGEEEIRFQVSADHTPADIDEVLSVLAARPGGPWGGLSPH